MERTPPRFEWDGWMYQKVSQVYVDDKKCLSWCNGHPITIKTTLDWWWEGIIREGVMIESWRS